MAACGNWASQDVDVIMLDETSISGVFYLTCGSTDLRKSIDELAVLVKEVF